VNSSQLLRPAAARFWRAADWICDRHRHRDRHCAGYDMKQEFRRYSMILNPDTDCDSDSDPDPGDLIRRLEQVW